jgi:hypothetical protein
MKRKKTRLGHYIWSGAINPFFIPDQVAVVADGGASPTNTYVIVDRWG